VNLLWTCVVPGLLIVATAVALGYVMGREVGREQGRVDTYRRLERMRRESRR
jgi:hypothetical protein